MLCDLLAFHPSCRDACRLKSFANGLERLDMVAVMRTGAGKTEAIFASAVASKTSDRGNCIKVVVNALRELYEEQYVRYQALCPGCVISTIAQYVFYDSPRASTSSDSSVFETCDMTTWPRPGILEWSILTSKDIFIIITTPEKLSQSSPFVRALT
jgi:hypothetical protein